MRTQQFATTLLLAITAILLSACAPASPLPQPAEPTPAGAPDIAPSGTVPSNPTTLVPSPVEGTAGTLFTDYSSVSTAPDLPRQELDPSFLPSDLHGEHSVGLGPGGEIYLVNLEDGQSTQITADALPKRPAALSEEYIAWIADQGHDTIPGSESGEGVVLSDIYVHDRRTGEQRRITTEPLPLGRLVMDGSRLVWEDRRNELQGHYTHADIYAFDLATNTEYEIAVAPGAQTSPSIHGDFVVWADNRDSPHVGDELTGCGNCPENRYDIYLYDFNTHTSRPLVVNEWLKSDPSIHGSRVVWTEYRGGPAGEGGMAGAADIYLLNLDDGLIRQVTATPESELGPLLSGDRLLWTVEEALDVIMVGPDGQELHAPTGVYVLDLNGGDVLRLTDYKEPDALLDDDNAIIIEPTMIAEELSAYSVALD